VCTQDAYCLREFKKFLDEKDPRQKYKDHLNPIMVEDGSKARSLWVCCHCRKVREDHPNAGYKELRKLYSPEAVDV
jgi:hypothetical protein